VLHGRPAGEKPQNFDSVWAENAARLLGRTPASLCCAATSGLLARGAACVRSPCRGARGIPSRFSDWSSSALGALLLLSAAQDKQTAASCCTPQFLPAGLCLSFHAPFALPTPLVCLRLRTQIHIPTPCRPGWVAGAGHLPCMSRWIDTYQLFTPSTPLPCSLQVTSPFVPPPVCVMMGWGGVGWRKQRDQAAKEGRGTAQQGRQEGRWISTPDPRPGRQTRTAAATGTCRNPLLSLPRSFDRFYQPQTPESTGLLLP
jgi:hypothetical protein